MKSHSQELLDSHLNDSFKGLTRFSIGLNPSDETFLNAYQGFTSEEIKEWADSNETKPLLSYDETQSSISSIKRFTLGEVGSLEWLQQHKRLLLLVHDLHCHIHILKNEKHTQTFIQNNVTQIILNELVVTEVWNENVKPLLLENMMDSIDAINFYLVLRHELLLLKFLEYIFFYSSAIHTMNETAHDILDYCYKKLVAMNAGCV